MIEQELSVDLKKIGAKIDWKTGNIILSGGTNNEQLQITLNDQIEDLKRIANANKHNVATILDRIDKIE